MSILSVRVLASSVVLVLFAGVLPAQRQALVPVFPPETRPALGGAGGVEVSGDSPLVFRASFAGRVGAAVDVVPQSAGVDTHGTFELTGIPAGAEILAAWALVTSFDTQADQPVSLTFAGQFLTDRQPDVMDPGGMGTELFCSLYRFDVTELVTGDGSYSYAAHGNSNAYGDALVVVFEHASLPPRLVALADGAESLAQASTTTTFPGLPPGAAELTLFTEADDVNGTEEVRWNGVTVAGPGSLFEANLGPYASLVTVPVTVTAGANELEIVTAEDWFGLHLALLTVDAQKVVLAFETEDDGTTPLANGQAVEGGDEFGALVRIDGFPASNLTAAIFDSTPDGPNDPSQDLDLLVDRGNLLILQERPLQSVPGVYDRPNDDAGGGRFEIDFLGREVLVCSLDLADIDTGAGTDSSVTLRDATGRTRDFDVPRGWTEDLAVHGPPGIRTLDLTSLAPQPGFTAVATASEDGGFDAARVVSMQVRLGGSGAIDDLTFFVPIVERTIDFEDQGIAPGSQVDLPPGTGFVSGGFMLEPTSVGGLGDLHVGNAVGYWAWNGTTVIGGHDTILVTRDGGGRFSLRAFEFAGFPGAEAPFSVVSSDGIVADFVPDGVSDAIGGNPDFERFVLPAGFEHVESVLFVHTGPGTNAGTFHLDALEVSFFEEAVSPLVTTPAPAPHGVRAHAPHPHDPLRPR